MRKLTVELRAAGNPDHGQFFGEGVIAPTQRMPVEDIEGASAVCRQYIEEWDLGGGNWTGGTIRDGTRVIGRIHYNGGFEKGKK